jgi:hypothetical protein
MRTSAARSGRSIDIAESLPTIAANPDRTAVGVALIMVAFRTHHALGNDARSDPVATTCAPSRATATTLRSTESPLFAENARPYRSLLAMGTLASG